MVEQSLRVEAREHVGGGEHNELGLSQQRELEEAAQRDARCVERLTSPCTTAPACLAPVARFHPPSALTVAANGYYRGQAVQYRACVYRRADWDL